MLDLDVPPIDFGLMSVNDIERDFGLDCTKAMQARGDSILSLGTPTVARADGFALTSADLTVSNVVLIAGNMKFGWALTANGNAARYFVTFPLTLQSGTTIARTIAIQTRRQVG